MSSRASDPDDEYPDLQVKIVPLGPSIVTPADALSHLVAKGNEFISEHLEWLAAREDAHPSSIPSSASTSTPTSQEIALITTPPLLSSSPFSLNNELEERQVPLVTCISQFCNCNPQVSAATISLASVQSIGFAASAEAFSSSILAVNSSLVSFSTQNAILLGNAASLTSALSAASSSLLLANSAAASVAGSASAAIAAISSSAASAEALVQQSASSAVGEALKSVSMESVSALALISSASAAIVSANAKATNLPSMSLSSPMAQALATISSSSLFPSASVMAEQASCNLTAMRMPTDFNISGTTFALILTFSVLGSSLVTAVTFWLVQRYRRRRIEERMRKEEWATDMGPLADGKIISLYGRHVEEASYEGEREGEVYSDDRRGTSTSDGWSFTRPYTSTSVPKSSAQHSLSMKSKSSASVSVSTGNRQRQSSTAPSYKTRGISTFVTIDGEIEDKGERGVEEEAKPRFKSWLSAMKLGELKRGSQERKKEREDGVRKEALRKAREGRERKERERQERERAALEEKRMAEARVKITNSEIYRTIEELQERGGEEEEVEEVDDFSLKGEERDSHNHGVIKVGLVKGRESIESEMKEKERLAEMRREVEKGDEREEEHEEWSDSVTVSDIGAAR
jgi:hypothetical protein